MKEIYNVIELSDNIIEVINDYTLLINKEEWKFKSDSYSRNSSLKIVQNENDFVSKEIFGNYLSVFGWTDTRLVYIVETNKFIFNTDSDNLDDILMDVNDGYCICDLITLLSKYVKKSFKICFSSWTDASGMGSIFIKYDYLNKKLKSEEQEQFFGLENVINSGHNLNDHISEVIKQLGAIDYNKIQLIEWLRWLYNEKSELDSTKEYSEKELEDIRNCFYDYPDYQLKEELYRPIYDLSCNEPHILAPDWW